MRGRCKCVRLWGQIGGAHLGILEFVTNGVGRASRDGQRAPSMDGRLGGRGEPRSGLDADHGGNGRDLEATPRVA